MCIVYIIHYIVYLLWDVYSVYTTHISWQVHNIVYVHSHTITHHLKEETLPVLGLDMLTMLKSLSMWMKECSVLDWSRGNCPGMSSHWEEFTPVGGILKILKRRLQVHSTGCTWHWTTMADCDQLRFNVHVAPDPSRMATSFKLRPGPVIIKQLPHQLEVSLRCAQLNNMGIMSNHRWGEHARSVVLGWLVSGTQRE